jgi:HSP20 family protein
MPPIFMKLYNLKLEELTMLRNNQWQLVNDLNYLFKGMPHVSSRSTDDSSVESGRWIPAVDIREEADKFVLLIDVPGVKREYV